MTGQINVYLVAPDCLGREVHKYAVGIPFVANNGDLYLLEEAEGTVVKARYTAGTWSYYTPGEVDEDTFERTVNQGDGSWAQTVQKIVNFNVTDWEEALEELKRVARHTGHSKGDPR